MNGKKKSLDRKALLWWVAIISLAISAALYISLKEQAKYDVAIDQRRMLFPLVGIIITGICIIAGTASRWFYPK